MVVFDNYSTIKEMRKEKVMDITAKGRQTLNS